MNIRNNKDNGPGMGSPYASLNQGFGNWMMPFPWPGGWQPAPFPTTPTEDNKTTKGKRARAQEPKPWDTDAEDSADEFKPKPAKRQTKASTEKKPTRRGKRTAVAQDDGAAPPSPMSASQQLMQRRVNNLPGFYHLKGKYAVKEKDECVSCKLYEGKVLLKPCGHCHFCYSCIDKLHKKSIEMNKLQMCPVSGCYEFVSGWFKMYNICV